MTTEATNRQEPDQTKQSNPSGSVNPMDKPKSPRQEGMQDPKNPTDFKRREDPSQSNEEQAEKEKRRAS